jgi:DnaJ-class molecular chaperone
MAQVEICGVCGGSGYNRCPICNGKGKIKKDAAPLPLTNKNIIVIGDSTVECETCQGTGKLLCKPCNGSGRISNEKPGSKGPTFW